MPVETSAKPDPAAGESRIRLAAAGDIHCSESNREQWSRAFADIGAEVDAILLAGDLTTHGEPEQARVLADACRPLTVPVVAVLGNHDWHAGRHDELVEVLGRAGITVLERGWTVCKAGGYELGIAGVKGFVGGFPGSHLSDFGEPMLRALYAETGEEVAALDEGLRAIALCPFRVALLHYAPTEDTLQGEPPGIWTFLGSDRLARPIVEHPPDLVLHGHAHAGAFEGSLGEVPVHNVSTPVIGREFWTFDLTSRTTPAPPIH